MVTSDSTLDSVVVLNPTSGTGSHRARVRDLAVDHGYAVRETQRPEHGVDLASEAVADGAKLVAAAGGDGTLNEVLRGVMAADGLDTVTVGIVPCGTGNGFAHNIGVTDIEGGFRVLDGGDRRWVDLGIADGRPFINSCVGGLTAEASAETTRELKRRLGTLAYVIETLRNVRNFESIRVTVDCYDPKGDQVWTGKAVGVLIGNGRRFPPGGSEQANMEDGRFDVTLVTDSGSLGLMTTATIERLLARQTPWTSRYRVPKLRITVDNGPVAFSLDGEIIRRCQLSLSTRPKAVRIAVGDDYDPSPNR